MNSRLSSYASLSPDELLQAWMNLRQQRPHTHDPEAADILGVPEAALHASRVGHGTVALAPDLPNLLAPLTEWRRVFVVNRSLFGVVIHSMRASSIGHGQPGIVRLHAPGHEVGIFTAGVRYCFYTEDQTEHGRSAGLAWFDHAGHVLGKILLRSRQGLEIARPYVLKHALSEQSRRLESQDTAVQAVSPIPVSLEQQHVEAARRLLRGLDAQQSISMHSPGMVARYGFPISKSSESSPWIHASSAEFKCHLRLDATARAYRLAEPTSPLQELCLADASGAELRLGFTSPKGDYFALPTK